MADDPILAFAAICIAILWKASSFMALMLLAGLQTIPESLYEAAEVDGAKTWQQFVEITLPMLRPAIFVALIFRTITSIQTFDIPFRHDRRRSRGFDRDARDVHPQDDAGFSRFRLRIGAGDADVRDQHGRDHGYLRQTRRSAGRGATRPHASQSPRRTSGSRASIVAINGFFPAVWILFTSLKTETELMQFPITYLPAAPTLANYYQAFTEQPLPRFLVNSFVVATLVDGALRAVSALAAYALTRLRIPRRNLIMAALMASPCFR